MAVGRRGCNFRVAREDPPEKVVLEYTLEKGKDWDMQVSDVSCKEECLIQKKEQA